jgi:cell division septum initiation protein DivIVA
MDDEMITQLRTIQFSEARKGFDKQEVHRFLAEVTEWVEGGGGDLVRRRLERIAHKSAQMLADAEDGAEGLRREAEQESRAMVDNAKEEAEAYRDDAEAEARAMLRDARSEASSAREAADRYVTDTTTKADDYAEQTRHDAKRDSDEMLDAASQQAKQTVRNAEQRAEQLIAEATRQREAIETVIGDLLEERDSVVANVRDLSQQLVSTAERLVEEPGVTAPARAEEPEQQPEPVKLEAVGDDDAEDEESGSSPRVASSPTA